VYSNLLRICRAEQYSQKIFKEASPLVFPMIKLVMVRHGESTWNKENRFTGWVDVPLSEKGEEEARSAGKLLKKEGFSFDIAFTSVLKRAVDTLNIMMREMGISLPVEKSWRLNERHYGALQGLNKGEMAAKYGEHQVYLWRRSYDISPPALDRSSPMHPGKDPLYRGLKQSEIPLTESLKDTVARVLPYWRDEMAPRLKQGKRAIVSAHGNSIRALIKIIDNVSDDEITRINIPTGIPLVYEFDSGMNPLRHYYLGNPEEVRKAIEKVESQGKAK